MAGYSIFALTSAWAKPEPVHCYSSLNLVGYGKVKCEGVNEVIWNRYQQVREFARYRRELQTELAAYLRRNPEVKKLHPECLPK